MSSIFEVLTTGQLECVVNDCGDPTKIAWFDGDGTLYLETKCVHKDDVEHIYEWLKNIMEVK